MFVYIQSLEARVGGVIFLTSIDIIFAFPMYALKQSKPWACWQARKYHNATETNSFNRYYNDFQSIL